ncbi:S10 family serine carboxypeptidase-like protein [Novosphingobium terrae]|uniref:S10 family serine carboxypeptidase-like protein n=1 Tax=Novosphingobium terrae TaxID=2726189 RepID=UPI00197F22AB|nr:hypothetical protein [Novosphingobium terrae]
MRNINWRSLGAVTLTIALMGGAPALAQDDRTARTVIAPLLHDDEAIIVTHHQIHTREGVLRYEARAGRLALRNDETGELRGYIYFTAYAATPRDGRPRPLTFLWNGGPTSNSLLLHTEMFGPRRLTADGMVDNAETLLTTSDLVFYDPVGTGFSRAGKDADKEFLTTLGDFAETAEFIRAYRARFDAGRQPLFLGGESYGTWRVNGTTEMLEKRGIRVSGALLISGGVPGSLMPPSFQDAMYVPARTATAFELKKLAPDLLRDKAATMKAVNDWIVSTYRPALEHLDALTAPQREAIAQALARFTGVRPDQIDRATLVMTNNAYKKGLFAGDAQKILNTYDMRMTGTDMEAEPEVAGRGAILGDYLRAELGYATDLAYTGLEDGYMPVPGPKRQATGDRWDYNHVTITPEVIARMKAGGGPPLSQPWLQNAMRADPRLQVFVAAGRYDSLNMCEGNIAMSSKLEPSLSSRFEHHCYEGGHMMYHVPETRLQLSLDVARFIRRSINQN